VAGVFGSKRNYLCGSVGCHWYCCWPGGRNGKAWFAPGMVSSVIGKKTVREIYFYLCVLCF